MVLAYLQSLFIYHKQFRFLASSKIDEQIFTLTESKIKRFEWQ